MGSAAELLFFRSGRSCRTRRRWWWRCRDLGCIGRVMRDRKQDARAPVAQSVSARYLYGSMCAGDAEVVSSILTWSTVLPASLRRFPLSFPSLMCLNLSNRVYSYLPLSTVRTKQRLCCCSGLASVILYFPPCIVK